MKAYFIFVLLIVTSCIGCQTSMKRNYAQPITGNTAILKTTIACLNIDNPETAVDKNINNKDMRFICVCGFGCYTPGIEKDDLALTRKYGIRCLEGTSDLIEGDEHAKLIETARKYAEAYNIILFKILTSKAEN